MHVDSKRPSALYYAVLHNNLWALHYLLTHAANLNIAGENSNITLHREEDMQVLKASHADDNRGDTLLMQVVSRKKTVLVEMLLTHEADHAVQDHQDETVLILAARFDYTNIAELSLKYRADHSIRKCGEFTALILAASYGHTVADITEEFGHTEIVELLAGASQIFRQIDLDRQKLTVLVSDKVFFRFYIISRCEDACFFM